MTNLNDVLRKAQALQEAFEKVQSNHFYWQKKTKPLLETTLKQIQTSTELNWMYQEQSPESVRLTLSDNQGIELGALSFRLSHNSLVLIDLISSTLNYRPETKVGSISHLYSLEPGLVDEALIFTSVSQFIDQLLKEFQTSPITYKDLRTTPNPIHIRTSKPKE